MFESVDEGLEFSDDVGDVVVELEVVLEDESEEFGVLFVFQGGITNGEDFRVSAWMKPISTLMAPLRSVDLATMKEEPAAIERSDVCAVPAAAVVGEAMVCLVLANAVLEKFGGDSLQEMTRAARDWDRVIRARLAPRSGPGDGSEDAR